MTTRALPRLRVSLELAVAVCLLVSSPLQAQRVDSLTLVRRATQISAMLGGTKVQYDTIFAPPFLQQLPPKQLDAVVAQVSAWGKITKVAMTATPAPNGAPASSAVFQLSTDKGTAIPMTLVLGDAPNLVIGLFFGAPTRTSGTLDDVLREVRALPGHASVLVARLDGSRIVPIVAEDTGRALGIGSAFKLYVLAGLMRDIESGRRRWSDVVPLDSLSKSLPSGVLQTWPAGTPVTLQTLATFMISISDNTAADHLLHVVGREKVEAALSVAGNTHAALDQPFLSTHEMFALKSPDNAAIRDRYARGSAAERRAILRDPAVTSLHQKMPAFGNGPIAINDIEWFASTADLARTMVWIRDHSASGPARAARDVMSVNHGIDWPAASWRYVGFKGGSEPGVLNLTFLAQRTDGQWFVVTGSWNNSDKAVDEAAFAGLVTRIRDLTTGP